MASNPISLSLTRAAGDTPTTLARAAMDGKLQECKRLLASGIDPNAEVEFGGTALIHAAAAGHVAICECLLDGGALTDAMTTGGYTALMVAAEKGREQVSRSLVRSRGTAMIYFLFCNVWLPLYPAL